MTVKRLRIKRKEKVKIPKHTDVNWMSPIRDVELTRIKISIDVSGETVLCIVLVSKTPNTVP